MIQTAPYDPQRRSKTQQDVQESVKESIYNIHIQSFLSFIRVSNLCSVNFPKGHRAWDFWNHVCREFSTVMCIEKCFSVFHLRQKVDLFLSYKVVYFCACKHSAKLTLLPIYLLAWCTLRATSIKKETANRPIRAYWATTKEL